MLPPQSRDAALRAPFEVSKMLRVSRACRIMNMTESRAYLFHESSDDGHACLGDCQVATSFRRSLVAWLCPPTVGSLCLQDALLKKICRDRDGVGHP
jgi:hypothetical protein